MFRLISAEGEAIEPPIDIYQLRREIELNGTRDELRRAHDILLDFEELDDSKPQRQQALRMEMRALYEEVLRAKAQRKRAEQLTDD